MSYTHDSSFAPSDRQTKKAGPGVLDPVTIPMQSPRLIGYLAWVNAWLEVAVNDNLENISSTLTIDELANIFRENALHKLKDWQMIQAVQTAQLMIKRKGNKLHGLSTIDITDPFSQSYDPKTECNCAGIYPVNNSEIL